MNVVLYNPMSGKGAANAVEALKAVFDPSTHTFMDVRTVTDAAAFLQELDADADVILCGGDGTLNRFINMLDGVTYTQTLFYYPTGSGNDFMHDIERAGGSAPVPLEAYIRDLPIVTVKGKTYRFINGVGYGIDGYCCEVGDKLRATSDKPVNYTSIAIKGLLFHYRPTSATVTVDGKTYEYKRVWIAPTMNGCFYGGGMMPAPAQDRLSTERSLSLNVMHNCGKLKILTIFPSLFKGEHIRHTKQAALHVGHDISVKFDRPVALQIDGETILEVTEYRAQSVKAYNAAENDETTAAFA